MQNGIFKENSTCSHFITYKKRLPAVCLAFLGPFRSLTAYLCYFQHDLVRPRSTLATMQHNKRKASWRMSGCWECFTESKRKSNKLPGCNPSKTRQSTQFTTSIDQNVGRLVDVKWDSYVSWIPNKCKWQLFIPEWNELQILITQWNSSASV